MVAGGPASAKGSGVTKILTSSITCPPQAEDPFAELGCTVTRSVTKPESFGEDS